MRGIGQREVLAKLYRTRSIGKDKLDTWKQVTNTHSVPEPLSHSPHMQAAGPGNQPAAASHARPSAQLISSLGHPFILFYLILFQVRCSNPGGYLHFLLLASSMREEEK